jgi:glucose-1-phosphate thymidylyltransferase
MPLVVFEDADVAQLYPISTGRPAFAITCGGYRLIELLETLDAPTSAVVRPHLGSVIEADFPALNVGPPRRGGPDAAHGSQPISDAQKAHLFVNARVVPSAASRDTLKQIYHAARAGIVESGRSVAAALLPPGTLQPSAGLTSGGIAAYLAGLSLSRLPAELPLFEYPHDVIRHHLSITAQNLEDRLTSGDYREIADGVFAEEGARLGEHVVTDTSSGLILLDRGASVGPHSLLTGPLYIGPHARVLEHAAIKDCVVLGHTTKIGGEVEASVIEPYTNKQHHGFLGHSYLGSWINLGAGTCNSDLKNTYGPVNMDYGGRRVTTDMQFVGVIMGDYSKSAINTGIFTGKTVGVCSMVYGFVTTNVPSFVNYARLFGQVTAAPVEVMVSTQARMFARRGVTQRPCDIQLVHDMYELTRHERELGSVPLEPLSL